MKNLISPHFSDDTKLLNVYESDLGVIYFYKNIVVSEFAEGVSLSYQNGFDLLLKSITYIGIRPIVLISNRINSYSVQPNDYKYLEKVPNIKGIAIVSRDPMGTSSANLESKFVKKNFAVFNSLEQAHTWGLEILEPYLTNSK